MFEKGIDIVVVNYKSPRDLNDFLEGLHNYPPQVPYRVVVANVEPSLRDLEIAEKWVANKTNAISISFPTNIGYAKAVNRSVLQGSKEIIAIFNADTIVDQYLSLDSCYEALVDEPSWGALGPRQVTKQPNGRLISAGIFGTNSDPRHRGWKNLDNGQYQDVRDDAIVVPGSILFTKRTLWWELSHCPTYQKVFPRAEGAFPPFQFYYEDTTYCYHLRAHGYRNVYYGPTTMIHKFHQSVKVNDLESTAKKWEKQSKEEFRRFCDSHGIERN